MGASSAVSQVAVSGAIRPQLRLKVGVHLRPKRLAEFTGGLLVLTVAGRRVAEVAAGRLSRLEDSGLTAGFSLSSSSELLLLVVVLPLLRRLVLLLR